MLGSESGGINSSNMTVLSDKIIFSLKFGFIFTTHTSHIFHRIKTDWKTVLQMCPQNLKLLILSLNFTL